MTVSELVAKFLFHKQRNGCRASTLRSYAQRLKKFVVMFGDRTPAELGREEVLNYLYLAGKGMSNSTQRFNIVVIEVLQAYAIDFDHLAAPWIRKKDAPKPPQGMRERIATEEETAQIIKAARSDFAAIYRGLRLTGSRPGELSGANITDIRVLPEARVIWLDHHKTSRKTGLPRIIPIGAAVAPLIDAAIGGRTEGRIFLDQDGKPWDTDRLSRHFRVIRDKLGLPKELVLYCARHEFATAVAKHFGILEASRLIGHTNVAMTQRYAKTPLSQLRDVQGKAIKDVDPGQDPGQASRGEADPGESHPGKAAA